jgi:hypothetical protein
LSQAMVEGPDPRGAFAVSLLRSAASSVIGKDREASQIVLREPDVLLRGRTNWSTLRLLVQARYLNYASAEQTTKIVSPLLNELGVKMQKPPATITDGRLWDEFLAVLRYPDSGEWSPTLQKRAASLILDGMVRWRSPSFAAEFRVAALPPYDKQFVVAVREQTRRVLDQWLAVVNPYLEKHLAPPYEPAVRQVVQSVGLVLGVYSDGDNWPANKTVALLSEQLQAYYTDNPQELTDQSAGDLLPASPAALLTQIVWSTGEIPGFVRRGQPKPKSVEAKLKGFETLVTGGPAGAAQYRDNDSQFRGLINEAPYEVIKSAVAERKASKISKAVPNPIVPDNPEGLLNATSGWPQTSVSDGGTPADPLLLLAVLADVSGQSQHRDERIATLLTSKATKDRLQGFLKRIFSGRLKAREHARRLLQKMARDTKSADLVNAIRDLDAAMAPPKP